MVFLSLSSNQGCDSLGSKDPTNRTKNDTSFEKKIEAIMQSLRKILKLCGFHGPRSNRKPLLVAVGLSSSAGLH